MGKFLLVGFSLVAGFLGGWLSTLWHVDDLPLDTPAVVRAEKFEVVDPQRRVVASLSQNALDLYDSKGIVRATLRLQYKGKGILAFSDGRFGRAMFGFFDTDMPSPEDDGWGIQFTDSRNSPVVSILVPTRRSEGTVSVRSKGRYNVWP